MPKSTFADWRNCTALTASEINILSYMTALFWSGTWFEFSKQTKEKKIETN